MESPVSKMIRRVSLCLVAIGAVVALGGCAFLPRPGGSSGDPPPAPDDETTTSDTSDETSDADFSSGPIPSDRPTFNENELPPEPGDSATPNKQIEWELVKFMNKFGMEYDASSEATCDHTNGRIDETIDCTGTYGGMDVDFTVDITGSDTVFNYTYKAQELPISREAAEEGYRYQTDSKEVTCDMDEYEMVNVGDTGVICKANTPTGVRKATVSTSKSGGSFNYSSL